MSSTRFIPITVAGVICFFTAFMLGAGLWFFFGSNPIHADENATVIQSDEPKTQPANVNKPIEKAPVAEEKKEVKLAPAGEVEISGGEVVLGGGKTQLPLKRVVVKDFSIGETEVTNAQYAEFIEATKNKAPKGWVNSTFPEGKGNEPVVGMTWADANAYCAWLSKKIGAEVRLPSEAEWERAARGDTDYKYPWGNDWNDEAFPNSKTNGTILPVKSLDKGRSPFGVYEMLGSVWEWTGDIVLDDAGKPVLYYGTKQRIIKGGSFYDKKPGSITIDTVVQRPEDQGRDIIGFRYVVIRKE